jgi:hypothetical protein
VAAGLSLSEQFIALFNNLKQAAGGNPERARIFYNQSEAIRDALKALNTFLVRTDLEGRLSRGPKLLKLTAPSFAAAWEEYTANWQFRISEPSDVAAGIIAYALDLQEPDSAHQAVLEERAWKEAVVERAGLQATAPVELRVPDPKTEDTFDPLTHNGGEAIDLGIECLETFGYSDLDQEWDNRRSLALGGYDYLINTIGLDVHRIFSRWRNVPTILMPAHVSRRYGASDKGSLEHLLDDAVKAYVFGARAAAMAMCRAVHDMLRNEHYGPGELENVVAHASAKWDFISIEQITKYRRRANWVMHNYKNDDRLNDQDDRIILKLSDYIEISS